MSSHKITISLATSGTGQPVDQTGVMGIIIQGIAVNGLLALDTPYSLLKAADLATYGITPAYDATNGLAVYQQLSEFYNQAGDGAQLWFMICATNTTYATYVQSATFSTFVQYTAQADPSRGAKIIGLCYAPPTVTQSAADFPADVTATITQAQIVQANEFQRGYCFGVIVDGYNMSTAVSPSTIGTQANNTAYAVSLCITGSKGNGVSAVGAALGRYARISIGHGVGDVADGALSVTQAFLTNGTAFYAGGTALTVGNTYLVVGGTATYNGVTYQTGQSFVAVNGHVAFTTADTGYLVYNSTPVNGIGNTAPGGNGVAGMSADNLDLLGQKQFFFLTTVQNIQGLYWNDGATCTAFTNFFSSMEYMRVACALAYDARAYLTTFRGSALPQDATSATGALDPTWIALKEKSFQTKYIDPLTNSSGSGDITGADFVISAPNYGSNGGAVSFTLNFERNTILGTVTGTIGQTLTL